ncbi:MAG: dethiobiotin synthase [Planctomycetes bacterium]|nr:dethiobiotin synthase [Planctomycetota bacterium]
MRGILVTGTDTGVGKTVVAGGIAAAFVRRHTDVGVMKPFATGAQAVRGRLVSEDARFLQRAAGVEDPLELINPVCLKPPLAPAIAAEAAGKPIRLRRVWSAWRILSARHSTMIVEGVGGLLVPLVTGFTVAGLARRLKLPLLIVTRPSLGTLNHTALTVHAARSHGLKIAGLVVNAAVRTRRGLAERLNPAALEAQTGVPILAEIPFLGDPARALRHPAFDRIAAALQS